MSAIPPGADIARPAFQLVLPQMIQAVQDEFGDARETARPYIEYLTSAQFARDALGAGFRMVADPPGKLQLD